MIGHNDEAEELMKKIEKEEEALQLRDPDKKIFHLCIINLAVGTLYCAQKNVDFGMGRIPKGIKPLEKMVSLTSWLTSF